MRKEKKFKDSQLGAGDYMRKFIQEATRLSPEEEMIFKQLKEKYKKELKKYSKLNEESIVGFERSIYIQETTTKRENEIIELLCTGYNYKEIAEIKTVAVSTIKIHVNKIFSKKGVRSLQELIVLSLTNQLKGKSLLEIEEKTEQITQQNNEEDFLTQLLG